MKFINITDPYGDDLLVEVMPNLRRVYVTIDTEDTYEQVSLTPKQARKVAKALKRAAKAVRDGEV